MQSSLPSSISQSLLYIQTILEEKGEALAAGSCRLTLTPGLTQEICSALYSSNRTSDNSHLHDLVSNVRAVRIIPEACSSSISQIVYLSPFHNLTYLEVRYIDVYSLIHLSKLRSQLKHLVLYSCVHSLNDVLLCCGGDKCVDSFLWSELHSLHVSNCDCLELDSGLQLAPWLKTLDLSFNSLSDYSIRSLDSLFSINHLSLNFNRLLKIPALAPSARSSLKILHLRQNHLENLKGLEYLCSLEELDVAYNCISKQDAVLPLSALPYLVNLCMDSNPISFSKDYRIIILQRVCTAVNKKKFQLDGQHLNPVEKDAVGTMAIIFTSMQLKHLFEPISPSQPCTNSGTTIQIRIEESSPNEEGGPACGNQTPLSNSVDASARLTSSASKLSLSAKRRKSIRMREAEIVDTGLQPPSISVDLTPQNVGDDEHLATKQRLEELRKTFGQENWLHSQAGDQVRQLLGWDEEAAKPLISEDRFLTLSNHAEETSNQEDKADGQSVDLTGEGKEESIVVLGSSQSSIEDNETEDEASDHVFLVQRDVDGVQIERLLTVSKWNICEKDTLSGATLFTWKMVQLKSLQILDRAPRIRLQLTFFPASLSCRMRVYSMEENDFSEFETLFPVVTDTGEEMDADQDLLHCMKCNQEFPKNHAAVKLRTASTANPAAPKGQLEEYPVCPFCGSDMVFAVEQQQSSNVPAHKMTTGIEESQKSDQSCGSSDVDANGDSSDNNANSGDSEGSVEVMDKMQYPSDPVGFQKLKSGSNGPPLVAPKSLKSTESSRSVSSHSSHSRNTRQCSVQSSQSLASFSYSYADFSQVDHRLRLYCEMFLTSHHSEEFLGLIKVELVTSLDSERQPFLLVVTSRKIYFLKIVGNQSDQPEKWLNKEASYSLNQLCCIMTIIGNQGLVLQLGKESVVQLYLVLLCDERRTKNVLHFIVASLEKNGLQSLIVDMMPTQWLALDGLIRGDADDNSLDEEVAKAVEETDIKTSLFLLCTCSVSWKDNSTSDNDAAIMVSNDQVALLRGDPRWLLSNNIQYRTWGVSLLSVQQVLNLVSLESFVSRPEELRLYFLDEASSMEEQWTIILSTREAVDQLVEAVRNPWESMFSVELEINELDE